MLGAVAVVVAASVSSQSDDFVLWLVKAIKVVGRKRERKKKVGCVSYIGNESHTANEYFIDL